MKKPIRITAILLALAFCLTTIGAAVNPLSYPKLKAWNPTTGAPLAGGKLYSFYPGGETPKNTYSDSGLTTANKNPVILDVYGEADVYLNGSTKLVLKTSADISVWTMDSVTTPNDYFIDAAAYGSNQAGIEAAKTAIGSNNRTLNLSAATWAITGDMTIPSNITLRMDQGAVLAISTGKTVTINGPLDAGPYQIFSCTSTRQVNFGPGAIAEAYPEWWGARADNSTDSLSGIQAAVNTGVKVVLAKGTYKLSGTLTFTALGALVPATGIIEGAGWQHTVLEFSNTTTPGIWIDYDNTVMATLNIKGMYICGPGGSSSGNIGISVPGGTDKSISSLIIENVLVSNWGGDGVFISANTGPVQLRDLYVFNTGGNGITITAHAVHGNPQDVTITGGAIQGAITGAALYVDGGTRTICGLSVYEVDIELPATSSKPCIYLRNVYGPVFHGVTASSWAKLSVLGDALVYLDDGVSGATFTNLYTHLSHQVMAHRYLMIFR